jgi:hypothetical protein
MAAALFFSLMSSATLGLWNESTETMTYTKVPDIIVTAKEVIVPPGVIVDRDITVQGGDLRIEGKVNGECDSCPWPSLSRKCGRGNRRDRTNRSDFRVDLVFHQTSVLRDA